MRIPVLMDATISGGPLRDVPEDIVSISVWREDGVEAGRDPAAAADQGEPFDHGVAGYRECRKSQGVGQFETRVTQQLVREVEAFDYLSLVGGVLRADAEDLRAEPCEVGATVSVRAGLRSASSGTGDGVPRLEAASGTRFRRTVRG